MPSPHGKRLARVLARARLGYGAKTHARGGHGKGPGDNARGGRAPGPRATAQDRPVPRAGPLRPPFPPGPPYPLHVRPLTLCFLGLLRLCCTRCYQGYAAWTLRPGKLARELVGTGASVRPPVARWAAPRTAGPQGHLAQPTGGTAVWSCVPPQSTHTLLQRATGAHAGAPALD